MDNTNLFTREGQPFSGTPVSDGSHTGFWRTDACHRCGGAGGFNQWPGFTCFDCRGNGKAPAKFVRLYTEAQLTKLNGTAAKREATRLAKRAAELDAKAAQFDAAYGELAKRAEPFLDADVVLRDILGRGRRFGSLSQAQADLVLAKVERLEGRAVEQATAAATSQYVGVVGERREFSLTVTRSFRFDGFYGVTFITGMQDALGNEFVVKSGAFAPERGTSVKVKATIKAHEEYKGVKQTQLARVAVLEEKGVAA